MLSFKSFVVGAALLSCWFLVMTRPLTKCSIVCVRLIYLRDYSVSLYWGILLISPIVIQNSPRKRLRLRSLALSEHPIYFFERLLEEVVDTPATTSKAKRLRHPS